MSIKDTGNILWLSSQCDHSLSRHHSSIRSAVREAATALQSTACLPDIKATHSLIMHDCRSFAPSSSFSVLMEMNLSLSIYTRRKIECKQSPIRSTLAFMEEKINLIPELVQQIRNAENNHNQLVDQYFAMSKQKTHHPVSLSVSLSLEEHVQQALTNLNNDPSSNHMLAYHHYSIHSETIMKAIRVQRWGSSPSGRDRSLERWLVCF